jgi:SEC-C motif-containing protein
MAKDTCPCGTGERYATCCGPFHKGAAEPPTAERLMRSRFSAFARREVGYLWRTLDAAHPDRARPEAEVRRELLAACNRFRYVRLHVLTATERPPGEESQVTFRAEVFESGKDRSFTEASRFRHDGTGWRYLSGEPVT